MMTLLDQDQRGDARRPARVSATSDPLLNSYVWQSPGKLFEHQPTVKIDYNLTDKHRLSGSYADHLGRARSGLPERRRRAIPGRAELPRSSTRRVRCTRCTLRSTLSGNMVNELRVGITALGGSSNFGDSDSSNGPQTFADQGGYAIVDRRSTDRLVHERTARAGARAPTYSIDESLTWQKGTHSLNFGGGVLMRRRAWENGAARWCRASSSASTPPSIRRSACSPPTNFPARRPPS